MSLQDKPGQNTIPTTDSYNENKPDQDAI